MPAQRDPLLRPFQLKHLTLRNRLMSTAHEPSFSEDGMPKDRYRLYHVEKAKGGIALTMTAGSAVVSPDSPPVFGNLLAYKDEIVPWMRRLSDDCHAHGAAVMIQLTHLGRRTAWNKADWLPVLAPSSVREPAHRAFPKAVEDWDVERIVADYAAAAQRMQAAGLDGIEIEAYGHLPDQFWSPATNHRSDEYGGSLDNRLRFTLRGTRRRACCDRRRVHRRHPHGRRRGLGYRPAARGGHRDRTSPGCFGEGGLPQCYPRPYGHRCGLAPRHPDTRHAGSATSRLCRRGARGDAVPGVPCGAHSGRGDGPARDRRGQARHGGDDARAHRRSVYRAHC